MSNVPTVLIVEDQSILRTGLRLSLEKLHNYKVIGEAADGVVAVAETHRLRPHVILMDIGLPRMDGIEATWKIKQEMPHTRIIMFTSRSESDDVTSALGSGADGYCTKETSIEQVAQAIETVMRGEIWLDPVIAANVVSHQKAKSTSERELDRRDLQILSLLKDGNNNDQIAQILDIDSQKIVQALQTIVQRFVAQTTLPVVTPNAKQKFSKAWFAGSADDRNGKVYAEKFVIESLIGTGGMGTVFKAKHMFIDRTVALKLLRFDLMQDPLSMRNFQREAKAIAGVQHPNIVTIYDFGFTPDDEPYIVMEYVEGKDLLSVMESEKRIALPRCLSLCLQICDGLAVAHKQGVIHCDLKPSNVLISGVAPSETVKLVDFGLAQIGSRDCTEKNDITAKFYASGTPLFMSPEQCTGKAVDVRTDVYSLGCVMFEALTGVNPFKGESVVETFAKQMQLAPPLISDVYPEGNFPAELVICVNQMLAKRPDERLQSMDEVGQKLLNVLQRTC